jgi:hypothetical protein
MRRGFICIYVYKTGLIYVYKTGLIYVYKTGLIYVYKRGSVLCMPPRSLYKVGLNTHPRIQRVGFNTHVGYLVRLPEAAVHVDCDHTAHGGAGGGPHHLVRDRR